MASLSLDVYPVVKDVVRSTQNLIRRHGKENRELRVRCAVNALSPAISIEGWEIRYSCLSGRTLFSLCRHPDSELHKALLREMLKDELAHTFPISDWNPFILDSSHIANAPLAKLDLKDAVASLGQVVKRDDRVVSAVKSIAEGVIPSVVSSLYWGRKDLATLNTANEQSDTGLPFRSLERGRNATFTGSFPYLCYHRTISSSQRQSAAKMLVHSITANAAGIRGLKINVGTKPALQMDSVQVAGLALDIVNVLAVTIVNCDFVKEVSGDTVVADVGSMSRGLSIHTEQPGSGWMENEKDVTNALIGVARTHLYPLAVTAHLIAQRLHVVHAMLGPDCLLEALRHYRDKDYIHIRKNLRSGDKKKRQMAGMVVDKITVKDLLCNTRRRLIETVEDPYNMFGVDFMNTWGRVSLHTETYDEPSEDRIDYTAGHTLGMSVLIEMIRSEVYVKDRPGSKLSTRKQVKLICGADEVLAMPEKKVMVVNVNDDRWDVPNEKRPRQILQSFYHGTRHVFMGALTIDLLTSGDNRAIQATEQMSERLWQIFRKLEPNYVQSVITRAANSLNNSDHSIGVRQVIDMGSTLFTLDIDSHTAVREALHMLCDHGIQATVRRIPTVESSYFETVTPRCHKTLPGELVIDAYVPIMGIGHAYGNFNMAFTCDRRVIRVEYFGNRATLTVSGEGRPSWLKTLCKHVYC